MAKKAKEIKTFYVADITLPQGILEPMREEADLILQLMSALEKDGQRNLSSLRIPSRSAFSQFFKDIRRNEKRGDISDGWDVAKQLLKKFIM